MKTKTENLTWFKEQLELLRTHAHSPKVNVSLYVTRAPASTSESESEGSEHPGHADSSSEGPDSPPLSPVGSDLEKNVRQTTAPAAAGWPSSLSPSALEKQTEAVETQVKHSGAAEKDSATVAEAVSHRTFFEYPVKAGRPDAASLIRDAVKTTPRNQRVLVAACGPDGLMHVVRDTTAKLIVGDGPAVELHCEQFGW